MDSQDGPKGQRKGCLRSGCLFLAAVGAILVLLPAVLVVIALIRGVPDPAVETRTLAPPGGSPSAVDAGDGGEFIAEPAPEPMTVILSFEEGHFKVVPGDSLEVTSEYDTATYELVDEFDPETRTYEVRFESTIGLIRRILAGPAPPPQVTVQLPRDERIRLLANVAKGHGHLELGGLDLSSVDLNFAMGNFNVQFDEPLASPLNHFGLTTELGEVSVHALGNASPATSEIEHEIGQVRIGLTGTWQNGADLNVKFRMADCRVGGTSTAPVVLERATVFGGGEEIDRPLEGPTGEESGRAVKLSVDGSLGALKISP